MPSSQTSHANHKFIIQLLIHKGLRKCSDCPPPRYHPLALPFLLKDYKSVKYTQKMRFPCQKRVTLIQNNNWRRHDVHVRSETANH